MGVVGRFLYIPPMSLSPSEDYGKTFQDVTHLINNTFVQTEFGIAIGPDNSGRVSTSSLHDYVDIFCLYRLDSINRCTPPVIKLVFVSLWYYYVEL